MFNRDVIVIGASAGGIEALQEICRGLPRDLDAAVLVVMHGSSHSVLPQLLSRFGPLPAKHPEDGEPIEKGRIYVAFAGFHMMVEPGRILMLKGPRENRHRPAIDPTFRSAALAYGARVIGVVLTGMLDDGTSGLMVIRAHGGTAVVQDPETALFPSMPRCALERVPDAHVVPLPELAQKLVKLVSQPVQEQPQSPTGDDSRDSFEKNIAEFNMSEVEKEIRAGKPSSFACPECGGVLWEIEQEGLLRFRCRVGHAYTSRHLRAEQRHAVETALWSGLRALEESASLYRRMADRARNFSHSGSFTRYEESALNAESNARTLRDFLVDVSASGQELDESAEIA